MPNVADRVRETTTTTGTGALNLDGAASSVFDSFVAGAGNGLVVYYTIVHRSAAEWEVGEGTITDASPDTLSRSVVHASSNSDALVNLSAGVKDVFVTMPALHLGRLRLGCGGRLSIDASDPYAEGVSATLYLVPVSSNVVEVQDVITSGGWFPAVIPSPAPSLAASGLTVNTNYDVYAYRSGNDVALEATAWTNDTVRAIAVAAQNGCRVKATDPTRRYMGTVRVIDVGGNRFVTRSTGSTHQRLVWNQHHQRPQRCSSTPSGTFTETSTSYVQINGGSADWVHEYVVGFIESRVEAALHLRNSNTGAGYSTTFTLSLNASLAGPAAGMSTANVDGGSFDSASARGAIVLGGIGYQRVTGILFLAGSTTITIDASNSGMVTHLEG